MTTFMFVLILRWHIKGFSLPSTDAKQRKTKLEDKNMTAIAGTFLAGLCGSFVGWSTGNSKIGFAVFLGLVSIGSFLENAAGTIAKGKG
ncbi:MAG: hypothetical protein NTY04_00355 [Candidatus Staskawiczbacteria bacterium]|nr:hypothetical protein [Candidatus Staskawiczbacteria bacterium]